MAQIVKHVRMQEKNCFINNLWTHTVFALIFVTYLPESQI